ncbi:hypothetical protein D3C76_78840 [compost metagenome]
MLVIHQGRCSILASTDFTLSATDIIRLYGYRFKIECTFREMKQVTGAFDYHFWSKSMPKLNRFLRKEEAHPLEAVQDEQDRRRIEQTIQAVEGFVKSIFRLFVQNPHLSITKIIKSKQDTSNIDEDSLA